MYLSVSVTPQMEDVKGCVQNRHKAMLQIYIKNPGLEKVMRMISPSFIVVRESIAMRLRKHTHKNEHAHYLET